MNNYIPNNKIFYYWLDPIRATAAILVLLVHTRAIMFETYGNLEPTSQNLFTTLFFALCNLGGFSVCLFYVLSGFLVGGKTIDKSMNGKSSSIRFFLDRLFRIGVPLTGALVLICIVNLIIGEGVSWIQLFGQYLGLQCILTEDYGGVFWTLPYEIWFYAIVLAFLLICGKSRHILIGATILVFSLMVFCNLLPQFLYILVCGMVCYFVKDHKFSNFTRKVLWILMIGAFVFYFTVHLHYFTAYLNISNEMVKFQASSQLVLFTLIALILSQYVTSVPSSKIGVFVNSFGKKLATFSYSLFLTHYQVLKIWQAFVPKMDVVNWRTIIYFILLCILAIAVAYIFYCIFERNTRRVQQFFETFLKNRLHII